jgi:hypothetical protein
VHEDIPETFLEEVETRRMALFETLSDLDDEFAEHFLSGDSINED